MADLRLDRHALTKERWQELQDKRDRPVTDTPMALRHKVTEPAAGMSIIDTYLNGRSAT